MQISSSMWGRAMAVHASRAEVTTSRYFSKILELTASRIIKMNKVYMSVRNIPNKLHLTDAKSCILSKLSLGSI